MNSTITKKENAKEVELEITIEASKFEEAIKKVYVKSAKYITIPGFRKGKAPMQIVEKYYGKEIFFEDAFNEVGPQAIEEAVKEHKLEVVSRPNVEIKQIEKGKDVIFTATFEVKPEAKIGKYKGIEVEKIEYNVTDEAVEHEIEHMQEHNARIISVEDSAVEEGNIATIDYDGSVDGVHFEGGKGENFDLTIGSKTFIPGFEDQVIGMKIGEEKDVKVTFPTEYHQEDLAGKEAIFAVKVNAIKKKELPKLDDEFAKDVSEYETLAELKASIKENMQKESDNKAKYETEEAIMQKIVETTEVEIPNGMIETEVDNMMKDMEQRLSYQGLQLNQYLSMMNKQEDDMREELKDQAEKSIKSRLALEQIIKAEKIEATEEELDSKIAEMAKNYGKEDDKEFGKNENVRNYIKNGLANEKALNFLIDNAKFKKAKKQETAKETKSKAKK